jgi:glycosyltransferase involved in cell wall biosynthesis
MVLAVGRLEEKKGFRYLVEACGLLTKRGTTVHCSIVGNGPEASALRNTISSHALEDVVTLVGQLTQDEIMELYRKASVFVLPSVVASSGDRDGLANVIIEAMAMEIPVISTTASAASEAIDDGANGFVIPPGDSAALADRIDELLRDEALREKMGTKGREQVIDRFDISANAAVLAELFQAVAEGPGHTTP